MGVPSYVAPAYGNYLLTEEADAYAGIRTVDVLIVLLKEQGSPRWLFMAPGLTIDKPFIVEDGYTVETLGRKYIITDVSEVGFKLITIKHDGEIVTRSFTFQEFLNPDESSQKSLLRCRTYYQIAKQHPDGQRDIISYDFVKNRFMLNLHEGNVRLFVPPDDFIEYIVNHHQDLEKLFGNRRLLEGFILFCTDLEQIRGLLLPEIRAILKYT